MDDMMEMEDMEESSENGIKSWKKTINFDDGSFKEVCVKQVDNGFIKTVTSHHKEGEKWKYDTKETIHDENPMEEKSLVSKLEEFLKNR
jgi:hypothetical protein